MRRSRSILALVGALALALVVGKSVAARTELAASRVPVADTTLKPTVRGDFNVRVLEHRGQRYFYQVFIPRDYSPNRPWPVIMALHGAARRGSDNAMQIRGGLATIVREQAATFPAIVVLPQSPAGTRGSDFVPFLAPMLDAEMKALNGDPARVYLTGLSFGGFLAYDFATRDPTRFAALVPVASSIDITAATGRSSAPKDSVYAAIAMRLRAVPMWVFQGEKDESVPAAEVRRIVQTFRAAGGDVRYTEFPGAPHDVWEQTYRTPELFRWLFAQHR